MKALGEGFEITGKAPDGVVEAISSTRHTFVHGVQWHPELTFTNFDFNLAMFRSHVVASGRYAQRRSNQTVGWNPLGHPS